MANDPWHLVALAVPALRARGLTGRGITIGVVDTGIAIGHPSLAASNVRHLDVRGGAFDGNDVDGHGTGMVGLIVGGPGAVAPEASIVSVKALLAGPQGDLPHLVSGIQLALDQGVDVLSLSVGIDTIDDSLSRLIQKAVGSGIVVVAAGEDGSSNSPLYPAALTAVISVTASNAQQQCLFDQLPAWMDIAVPGAGLPTLSLQDTTTSTGTSPATAVSAAVCALLLQIAPAAKRRALAGQLLGFLSSTGQTPADASGPSSPKLLVPAAAAAEIDKWLAQ